MKRPVGRPGADDVGLPPSGGKSVATRAGLGLSGSIADRNRPCTRLARLESANSIALNRNASICGLLLPSVAAGVCKCKHWRGTLKLCDVVYSDVVQSMGISELALWQLATTPAASLDVSKPLAAVTISRN